VISSSYLIDSNHVDETSMCATSNDRGTDEAMALFWALSTPSPTPLLFRCSPDDLEDDRSYSCPSVNMQASYYPVSATISYIYLINWLYWYLLFCALKIIVHDAKRGLRSMYKPHNDDLYIFISGIHYDGN
jgi:hypothetical protein